jgi:hypothetical protein
MGACSMIAVSVLGSLWSLCVQTLILFSIRLTKLENASFDKRINVIFVFYSNEVKEVYDQAPLRRQEEENFAADQSNA